MNKNDHYVAFISHPNAGKTTLFNQLTGKKAKVVNYPGSTVDFEIANLMGHPSIKLMDVPGITSLKPRSEDEKIALKCLSELDTLLECNQKSPDLILSLIDMTQLSRHLVLTKQLIEKNYPIVVVLTMADLSGAILEIKTFSQLLGCPVVLLNARNSDTQLKKTIVSKCNEKYTYSVIDNNLSTSELYRWSSQIEKTITKKTQSAEKKLDLDAIFLHPIWGGISFVGVMSAFFYTLFILSVPFMDIIDSLFVFVMDTSTLYLPEHWAAKLLVEGCIGGLAAILVFVPQIAILFFGVGIMESTGYLARAAVLVDRPLSLIGLSGRAFVPLLSGFACSIPAMLAARNIPQQKQRLLCVFLIPLMQCSARLPVYGLLVAMLFGTNVWMSALSMTLIYISSIVLAVIISVIAVYGFNVKDNQNTFYIELPQWRMPIWKNIGKQVLQQTTSFITGAGPTIIVISIILWCLSSFPTSDYSFVMIIGQWIEPIFLPMGLDWRVGVAILLSFAAREVFVSALVVLFSITSEHIGMLDVLQDATFSSTGEPIFTGATIMGLIVFFMVAMQCASTLAVAKKELKSWKLPLIQLFAYIGLAYILSVSVVAIF